MTNSDKKSKIKSLLTRFIKLFSFKKISGFILPTPNIGGLQITNSSVRFMSFEKRTKTENLLINSSSLRLPPDMVVDGRIKDRPEFVKTLKKLHSKITQKENDQINAVLTIPAGDVYVEVFNLPKIEDEKLAEAAELNMQAISPDPIQQSYHSWMVVGGQSEDSQKIEILGSFARKEIVDEMISAVEEANFSIAAIEFSSLSLNRILVDLGVVKKENPYLLLKLTNEGLIFMLIRNGYLHFNYFHSWGKVSEEKEITLESTLDIIKSESQRVLNYYSSHYGEKINNIILITPVLAKEIFEFLESNYKEFEIIVLRSDKDNLHGVRGAALRGLVKHKEDKDINLMSKKMLGAFMKDRINHIVSIWRNVVITASIFVLFVFGLSAIFINAQASKIRDAELQSSQIEDIAEFDALVREYSDSNSLITTLSDLKEDNNSFSPFMDKINSIAGGDVDITAIGVNSSSGNISISGRANNQTIITNFRNQLEDIREIESVNMSLSDIVSIPDGGFRFSMTAQASRIR